VNYKIIIAIILIMNSIYIQASGKREIVGIPEKVAGLQEIKLRIINPVFKEYEKNSSILIFSASGESVFGITNDNSDQEKVFSYRFKDNFYDILSIPELNSQKGNKYQILSISLTNERDLYINIDFTNNDDIIENRFLKYDLGTKQAVLFKQGFDERSHSTRNRFLFTSIRYDESGGLFLYIKNINQNILHTINISQILPESKNSTCFFCLGRTDNEIIIARTYDDDHKKIIYFYDIEKQQFTKRIDFGKYLDKILNGTGIGKISLSPDGNYLIIVDLFTDICLLDIKSNEISEIINIFKNNYYGIIDELNFTDWSWDGKNILFTFFIHESDSDNKPTTSYSKKFIFNICEYISSNPIRMKLNEHEE